MRKPLCILGSLLCIAGMIYGPVLMVLVGFSLPMIPGLVFWETLMLALLRWFWKGAGKKDPVSVDTPSEAPAISRMEDSAEK